MTPPAVLFIRNTAQAFFKQLGFSGPQDLLASAFGLKYYKGPVLLIQISGTALATVVAFCAEWVWDPPRALFLLVLLDLLNGIYGYRADHKLNGAPFSWSKAERTVGKIVATVILLFCCRQAVASYPQYYKLLADGLFGWLFVQKFRKLGLKMVALKASDGGLPKLIQTLYAGLLTSKYGEGLVDSLQGKVGAPKDPAAEEADREKVAS